MRTLPVIRQSIGQYNGNTHVGKAGYYDDFRRLMMVGLSQANVAKPTFVRVFEAEIRSGKPYLCAQMNVDGEWRSPFVWHPTWSQYDQFWAGLRAWPYGRKRD